MGRRKRGYANRLQSLKNVRENNVKNVKGNVAAACGAKPAPKKHVKRSNETNTKTYTTRVRVRCCDKLEVLPTQIHYRSSKKRKAKPSAVFGTFATQKQVVPRGRNGGYTTVQRRLTSLNGQYNARARNRRNNEKRKRESRQATKERHMRQKKLMEDAKAKLFKVSECFVHTTKNSNKH